MEDEQIATGELSSELTGINKGEKEQKKKQIIIAAVFSVILLILLIIIIILATKKSGTSERNFKGEIKCVFDVQSPQTTVFSEAYVKTTDFDIYINDKITKYSKSYKFNNLGKNNVTIKMYNKINIDYMFKDVKNIISVEMISQNNDKITSMISTFVYI